MAALSEEEREGGREGVEVSGGEGSSGSFAECVNPVKWPGNEESIGRASGGGGWPKLPRSAAGPVRIMRINIEMNLISSCILKAMMC